MQYEIRELNVGGILDRTIVLCRDHFKFLATIVGVVIIPPNLMLGVIGTATGAQWSYAGEGAPPVFSAGNVIFLLLSIVVAFAVNALAQGAIAYGIAHRYLGNNISAGDAIRKSFGRIGRLLYATFLYGFGIGLGMVLCVIPGIYFALAWCVVYPVLMFEDLAASRSLSRSRQLMVGHKMKAFVLAFLLVVITWSGQFFASIVPTVYATVILSEILTACLMAVNAVAGIVIYFSARSRVEHFDLELLAQIVEGESRIVEPGL